MTAPELVLRGAQVLDEGGGFAGPLDVHVRDGRVAALAANLDAAGAVEVDCTGLWLLPGIFDCHDHVTLSTVAMLEILETPASQWALESARNARRTLEAGVTFVRDLAGADRGIRDALALGIVPGPHLQISVTLICQTGGHGDA